LSDRITAIGAYTYNFAKNIEWENENDFSEFNILLISNNQDIIAEFQKFSKQKTIQNKKINLTVSQTFDEKCNPRLIFISKDFESMNEEIYTKIQGKKILLLTENFEDKRLLMINLFDTEDNTMLFEINKANILIQGLIILPDLIMMGGEEIDIAKIYLATINNLIISENKLDSIKSIQLELSQQIFLTNNDLTIKEQKLIESEKNFSEQEIILIKRQTQIDSILRILIYVQSTYNKLKDSIISFDKSYKLKLEMLESKENEINENLKIISNQKELIESQDKKIDTQDNSLLTQGKQIELQRKIVILLLITVILILSGIIFSIKAFYRKQRINKLLREQTHKLNDSLNKLQTTKDQLSVAKNEADIANKAKTEFISNMSHELRTPLNAIIGFSYHLKSKSNLLEKQKEQISTIHKSGEHLLSMINDILDFGKLEIGNTDFSYEIADLESVIADTYNISKIGADEKELKLFLEKEKNLPQFIYINQRIIKQIILNILSNAIKYTQVGSVYFRVKYDLNLKNLIIEVEDTGIGISNENIKQIFMPFTRIENNSYQAKGTGLGLAIVKQQVQNMNGKIEVLSQPGKGSKFTVFIPAELINNPINVHKLGNEKQITGYIGKIKKILVVDNNISNCNLISDILEEKNFYVKKAENGKIALDILKNGKFDLIILDLAMPVLNGIETGKILRNELPEIKIIGVSAFSQEKKILDDFIKICDVFISKPVDILTLFDTLKNLLKIKWTYELKRVKDDNEIILSEEIFIPPVEIIKNLLIYLNLGDYDSIEENINTLINENPKYLFFKQKINTFINNFEEAKLEKYLNTFLENDKI
jgi:signal transduction histidine kinase/CheY-like chemotaxis protein